MKSARNIFSKVKKGAVNKNLLLFACILFMCITPLFAADTIETLDTWGGKILTLFQSTWVKVLLLVALIVEAISMVLAGQQGGGGQVLKRFAPWIIGTIILLSASGICSYFLGDLHFEVSFLPYIPTSGSIMLA
nr:TrbC/VirB2 family protein [Treponema socranskii]